MFDTGLVQIPEFDNLYLDMNGIIHVCSHPEDDNPHFRITEEKIFADIMYYLEVSCWVTGHVGLLPRSEPVVIMYYLEVSPWSSCTT